MKLVSRAPRSSSEMSIAERLYLPLLSGFGVTIRHFLKNLINMRGLPTINYPEERRDYSERFRGRHALRSRPDGTLKCVACYMCSTVCPAECIHIEAGEAADISVEKFPVRFDIDLLRCVYCGFCVDACPEDAIVMTRNYELSSFTRAGAIATIETLQIPAGHPEETLGYRPYYQLEEAVLPRDFSLRALAMKALIASAPGTPKPTSPRPASLEPSLPAPAKK